MTALPEGWRGRAVALGLLGLAIVAVALLVVAPLLDLYDAREAEVAHRRALAARIERIAGELPALQAEAKAHPADAAPKPAPGSAKTDAVAGADLAAQVKALAQRSGVAVLTTESVPPEGGGADRQVAVSFRLSGPYAAIVRLVAGLPELAPAPITDAMDLHAGVGGGGDAAGALEANLRLHITREAKRAS
jgi:hypothetical protein